MNSRKPGAVVIGGDFQGLGVLRSLSRNRVPTFLIDTELCIGRFSRHTGGFARCPHPRSNDGKDLVDFLLTLARTNDLVGWVLFPNDDDTVRALSLAGDELRQLYRVPVPGWDTIRQFAEKRRTHELALRIGIPTPRTYCPRDVDELPHLDLAYPVILKPSTRDPFYRLTRRKAVMARDVEELMSVWRWARDVVPSTELMIQELIPGGAEVLFSLGAYFKGGRLKGRVVAHRRRQHPMDFGHATTFAETVDIPELEEMGSALLGAAGYEGLAEVEFMHDRRDGAYKLLEVNPRVWGWHTLAGRAGVDLPYLLYRDEVGEGAGVVDAFAKGVKWLRPITDTPTALSEMLKGRLGLGAYLSSITGPKELAPPVSLDDPAPFLAELLLIPYLFKQRGF